MSKLASSGRTQAERTATTRAIILEAAVTCLCDVGYGATTTILVAQTAGVSRGAMLHHFPSKRDLIFAVAAHAIDHNRKAMEDSSATVADPVERYASLPERRWAIATEPQSIALLEIIVGARSDPAVAEHFMSFGQDLLRGRNRRLREQAEAAGAQFDDQERAVSRAIAFAIRGMTIEKQLDPGFDPAPVLEVLRGLKTGALPPRSI